MFTARINGQRLGELAAHGPITVEYGPHGSEAAGWEMSSQHPLLRAGALVEVYDGGFCIWSGTLVEPGSDGQYSAIGLWHQAERAYALNGTDDITTYPQDAIQKAIARGDVSWASGWANFPLIQWGNPEEPMTLAALLDGYTAEQGTQWAVGPDRIVYHAALPTTPRWVVPHAVAGRGLTPAEDEFYSHLVGRYLDAGGIYRSTTVGSADAASVFGRRVRLVDLTDLGNTTQTRADEVLQGMLLKSGARMGWGEGLELGYGQITTPGGTPAALNQITSLQMVRLGGTVDTSKPMLLRGYTDIVLGSVKYTDGSRTISATPMGYAPRNLSDVLTLAVSE